MKISQQLLSRRSIGQILLSVATTSIFTTKAKGEVFEAANIMEKMTDQLIAIENIKKLKAQYFRYIDTKKWDQLRELFSHDALIYIPESRPSAVRVDEFMNSVKIFLATGISIHHGHMCEIKINDVDKAEAVWAMSDDLYFPDKSTQSPASEIHGAGHYHETYIRADGRWLFNTIRLTRLRLETVSIPRAIL